MKNEVKLTNEQVIKVQNYFSNLNNLKYFLGKDEKDCKSNKAGTKANVRTKYGIITVNLTTILNTATEKAIEITSKEVDLKINMFFFSNTQNIGVSVCTFVWRFNPYCNKPAFIQTIHDFLGDEVEKAYKLYNKIQAKVQEIANN